MERPCSKDMQKKCQNMEIMSKHTRVRFTICHGICVYIQSNSEDPHYVSLCVFRLGSMPTHETGSIGTNRDRARIVHGTLSGTTSFVLNAVSKINSKTHVIMSWQLKKSLHCLVWCRILRTNSFMNKQFQ